MSELFFSKIEEPCLSGKTAKSQRETECREGEREKEKGCVMKGKGKGKNFVRLVAQNLKKKTIRTTTGTIGF